MKGIVEPAKELTFYDQVDLVKSFCHFGNRLNASGWSKVAEKAKPKIRWIQFRECVELLNVRKLSSKIKRQIYRRCVRSAMLYGSETWCEWQNQMAIWKRTEKVMIRAKICKVKPIEKGAVNNL